MEKSNSEEDFIGNAEEKSSCWIERTSAGKLKYGCKGKNVDMEEAMRLTWENFKRFEKEILEYEKNRAND